MSDGYMKTKHSTFSMPCSDITASLPFFITSGSLSRMICFHFPKKYPVKSELCTVFLNLRPPWWSSCIPKIDNCDFHNTLTKILRLCRPPVSTLWKHPRTLIELRFAPLLGRRNMHLRSSIVLMPRHVKRASVEDNNVASVVNVEL